MTYDLTQFNSTNARTNLDLVEAVNTASGGLFVGLLLFAIFFVAFIMLRKSGLDGVETFVSSSFITTGFAVILFAAGLLDWYFVNVCLSVFILSLVVWFLSSRQ